MSISKNSSTTYLRCAVNVTERKVENEKVFVNSLQYLVNSFRKTYIQSLCMGLVLLVTAASGVFAMVSIETGSNLFLYVLCGGVNLGP